MATLEIRLFGSLQVHFEGIPVTELCSKKALALLAYLCVEGKQPHRRDKLAGMLWPDSPESTARGNLRHTLSELRKAIRDHDANPSFLLTSSQSLQFNLQSDAWLDVYSFSSRIDPYLFHSDSVAHPASVQKQLEKGLRHYRGPLLEGFSLPDSFGFEEWLLVSREQYHRLAVGAMQYLIGEYQDRGDYDRALDHAWRLIDLDPWREQTHRQLMRLLAYTGQRGAALAQFEICQQMLAKELHVKPGEKTKALYQKIRDGKLGEISTPAKSVPVHRKPPLFIDRGVSISEESTPFVAREKELAQLDQYLQESLTRDRHLAFVRGEAGSGKTALLAEFTRSAMEDHPELLVVKGNCSAKIGAGDPFHPFRQILKTLTGDIQTRWMAGAISSTHARRLWDQIPLVVEILTTRGKDLLDAFLSSTALLERSKSRSAGDEPWIQDLERTIAEGSAGPESPGAQITNLYDQYASVLQALSLQKPLVLILDDLQWCDAGSIELFFHLSRVLLGSRILMVGAYRPEEIAPGRNGEGQPLQEVIHEARRVSGDLMVDLDQADDRKFLEAYLDTEPNLLDTEFRNILFQQTGGHPLYTIEMLRGLQERGDIRKDDKGRWIEGPELNWEILPESIEGMIADRIDRLPDILQRVLTTASIEGEVFTAEVAAAIVGIDDEEIIPLLSGDLDRKYRLVTARDIQRIGDQRISKYQFRHILYQTYLFDTLDDVERVLLHEQVGKELERIYGDQIGEIVASLAHHFQHADIKDKAVEYHTRAGDQAVKVSANQEAITHFTRALSILRTLPLSPERDEEELRLLMSLFTPLMIAKGFAHPELEKLSNQARILCERIGSTPQLFPILFHLGSYYSMRGRLNTALELKDQMFSLADQFEDPTLKACAHWAIGFTTYRTGNLIEGRQHLEQAISFYDPEKHHQLSYRFGSDPGIASLSWASWVLWILGYPDQALDYSHRALAIAQQLSHPSDLALAQGIAAYFHLFRGEVDLADPLMDDCFRISNEHGFPNWLAAVTFMRGWASLVRDQFEKAVAQIQQGFQAHQELGFRDMRSVLLSQLAKAHGKAGQVEVGLETIGKAADFVAESDERFYEAEMIRLHGELFEMDGRLDEAEQMYLRAIEVSRQQEAKTWELRATMNLSQLWHQGGRGEEAYQLLRGIFEWFREGFDTPDLLQAQALLERFQSH